MSTKLNFHTIKQSQWTLVEIKNYIKINILKY
jgi:hypothetical protein